MQRLTCVVFTNLVHYYGKKPCQCSASGQLVASFPGRSRLQFSTILIFGMGTRLLVRMRTKLLIDQGEVEAMKTPIGCRALRCDKD